MIIQMILDFIRDAYCIISQSLYIPVPNSVERNPLHTTNVFNYEISIVKRFCSTNSYFRIIIL